MRRIRYAVAMSLDGYIAGPNGESDWIPMDPDIDFGALMASFDTILMGRRTFDAIRVQHGGGATPGTQTLVASRTLRQADFPGVTILGDNLETELIRLRDQSGKDIWLFGGGGLFRSLLDAGLVDGIEVAIVPVILGGGIPFVPPSEHRAKLRLVATKVYKKTGITSLEYAIER